MALTLDSVFPNFAAKTTHGDFMIHDHIKDSWAIIFSHPADFTPVCTTELAKFAHLQKEFDERGVKLIGFSLDSVESHKRWIEDIKCFANIDTIDFPIIAADRKLANSLGMLGEDELDDDGLPVTVRAVFFIGPDLKLKASLLYPATTGRNFDEIVRIVDSVQLTYTYKYVVTPADWKVNEKVIIQPKLAVEETPYEKNEVEHIPLPSGLNYARFAPAPSPR